MLDTFETTVAQKVGREGKEIVKAAPGSNFPSFYE